MYMELCGSIKFDVEQCSANFQYEPYLSSSKWAMSLNVIPLYVIVEAMAQISCRTCSIKFFSSKRTVPVQIKDLLIHAPVIKKTQTLKLTNKVEQKGMFAISECKLVDETNRLLASANFTVSRFEHSVTS